MQHVQSSSIIYFTREYARFRMITGNRPLNDNKIKKIIADIQEGTDILMHVPIICIEKNGLLDIIDGQHRFYVARRLLMPVYYTIASNLTLYQIAKINSNQEKWKPNDFVNCYVQLDDPNYKIMQDLQDKYPVPNTTLISLLQSGKVKDGGGTKDAFERGEFKAKFKEITEQIIADASLFTFSKKFGRQFIKAIIMIRESNKLPMVEIAERVNQFADKITIQDTAKDYCSMLENVFNYNKAKRTTIY